MMVEKCRLCRQAICLLPTAICLLPSLLSSSSSSSSLLIPTWSTYCSSYEQHFLTSMLPFSFQYILIVFSFMIRYGRRQVRRAIFHSCQQILKYVAVIWYIDRCSHISQSCHPPFTQVFLRSARFVCAVIVSHLYDVKEVSSQRKKIQSLPKQGEKKTYYSNNTNKNHNITYLVYFL